MTPDPMPQDIQAQLPWYLNATLSDAERAQVDRHLTASPDMQKDLEQWRRIADATQAVEVGTPAPTQAQFAALMAQIDAEEALTPATQQKTSSGWAELRAKFEAFWQASPGMMRLALVGQTALIAMLAGALVWQALPSPLSSPSGPAKTYETRSSPASARPANRGRIRLVLADKATVKDMRELLATARAMIVSGPSPLGVLTIEIPLATASPKALATTIEELRAHAIVELAEPASAL